MEISDKGKRFENWLKSIGGLENGYYPDRDKIDSVHFFEIDDGWLPLVKQLIKDLINAGWDRKILQVKEKFGGLRFYINLGSDEIFNLITKAEEASYTICETCGTTEKIGTTKMGWRKTICKDCEIKQSSNLNNWVPYAELRKNADIQK